MPSESNTIDDFGKSITNDFNITVANLIVNEDALVKGDLTVLGALTFQELDINNLVAETAIIDTATITDLTLENPLPTTSGGTGLATLGTAGQVLSVNSTGTGLVYASNTQGSVTSVSALLPLSSSGGTTPTISIPSTTGTGSTVVLKSAPDLIGPVTVEGDVYADNGTVGLAARYDLTEPSASISINTFSNKNSKIRTTNDVEFKIDNIGLGQRKKMKLMADSVTVTRAETAELNDGFYVDLPTTIRNETFIRETYCSEMINFPQIVSLANENGIRMYSGTNKDNPRFELGITSGEFYPATSSSYFKIADVSGVFSVTLGTGSVSYSLGTGNFSVTTGILGNINFLCAGVGAVTTQTAGVGGISLACLGAGAISLAATSGLISLSSGTIMTFNAFTTITHTAPTSIFNSYCVMNRNVNISGLLSCQGGASITGSVKFFGQTTFGGGIIVTGTSKMTGPVNITGTVTVTGSTIVSGAGTFRGGINATGSSNFKGPISVSGNSSLFGQLYVSGFAKLFKGISIAGKTDIIGPFNVTGTTIIKGSTSITGSADFKGPISVSGNSSLFGQLYVSGFAKLFKGISIAGKTDIAGSFNVTGPTSIKGFTSITGNMTVSGVGTIQGRGSINGGLVVNGGATINMGVTVNGASKFTGKTTVTGTMTVSGKSSLNGGMSVAGPGSVIGNLSVSGSSTVNGLTSCNFGLSIKGATNATGLFKINGPLNVTTGLSLQGGANISGALAVQGGTTIQGAVVVTGPINTSGLFTATGGAVITGVTFINGATQVTGALNVTGSFSTQLVATFFSSTYMINGIGVLGGTTIDTVGQRCDITGGKVTLKSLLDAVNIIAPEGGFNVGGSFGGGVVGAVRIETQNGFTQFATGNIDMRTTTVFPYVGTGNISMNTLTAYSGNIYIAAKGTLAFGAAHAPSGQAGAATEFISIDTSLVSSGGYTLKFPATIGTANSIFLSGGAGPLSWLAPGAANTFLYSNGTEISWTTSSSFTDWANPGTIGSSTPNTGAFSTLTASQKATFTGLQESSYVSSLHTFINLATEPTFVSASVAPNVPVGGVVFTAVGKAVGPSTSTFLAFVNNTIPEAVWSINNSNTSITQKFNGTIMLTAPNTLITSNVRVNSGNVLNQTTLNPAVTVFADSTNEYGMDLGYNASVGRYRTRIFCAEIADGDIALSTRATSATTQAQFTDRLVVRGDTGNIEMFGKTLIQTSVTGFTEGVLNIVNSTESSATIATFLAPALLPDQITILSIGKALALNQSAEITYSANLLNISSSSSWGFYGSPSNITIQPTKTTLNNNTFISGNLTVTNGNIFANQNIVEGFTEINNGDLSLTAASPKLVLIRGGSGSIITLPDATTLIPGYQYTINNNSSNNTIVNQHNSGSVGTIIPENCAQVTCINTSSPNGQWDIHISGTSQTTDWANPGTIGSATPNTGAFTTLTATSSSSSFTSGVLNVVNSSTSSATIGSFLAPNLPSEQSTILSIGKAAALNQSADISYTYNSVNFLSSSSWGFYGAAATITIQPFQTTINTDTAVIGYLQASGIAPSSPGDGVSIGRDSSGYATIALNGIGDTRCGYIDFSQNGTDFYTRILGLTTKTMSYFADTHNFINTADNFNYLQITPTNINLNVKTTCTGYQQSSYGASLHTFINTATEPTFVTASLAPNVAVGGVVFTAVGKAVGALTSTFLAFVNNTTPYAIWSINDSSTNISQTANGNISLEAPATLITGNLRVNSGNVLNQTTLNPAVTVFSDNINQYGMDLGWNASVGRYRTRIFCAQVALGDIALSTRATSATTQAQFTDRFVVRGNTGNIEMFGKTLIETSNTGFAEGILNVRNTSSATATIATFLVPALPSEQTTILSIGKALALNQSAEITYTHNSLASLSSSSWGFYGSASNITITPTNINLGFKTTCTGSQQSNYGASLHTFINNATEPTFVSASLAPNVAVGNGVFMGVGKAIGPSTSAFLSFVNSTIPESGWSINNSTTLIKQVANGNITLKAPATIIDGSFTVSGNLLSALPTGSGVNMGVNATYAGIQLYHLSGSYIDFSESGVDYNARLICSNSDKKLSYLADSHSFNSTITTTGSIIASNLKNGSSMWFASTDTVVSNNSWTSLSNLFLSRNGGSPDYITWINQGTGFRNTSGKALRITASFGCQRNGGDFGVTAIRFFVNNTFGLGTQDVSPRDAVAIACSTFLLVDETIQCQIYQSSGSNQSYANIVVSINYDTFY